MKILLVNPNRYTHPPVPPLGLEYLAAALENSNHEYRLLDLTFSTNPASEISDKVSAFGPDLAGITVRNIDSGIPYNTLFFLDEVAGYVELLNELGLKTVAGGAGFGIAPSEVLAHIGASLGVDGPGESEIVRLLDRLENGENVESGTILDGWKTAGPLEPGGNTLRVSAGINFRHYLDEGAVGGFRTQSGCRGTCPYCTEANRCVRFRPPELVVAELKQMLEHGVDRFHLCDSEFNQDLVYCHNLLDSLLVEGLVIDWALYMKTAPCDAPLFSKLAKTGANLITFTYPSCVPDEPARAAEAIRLAKESGIRVAVDYLCGFPRQSDDDISRELDILRGAAPDTVGVNNCIRLYPGTRFTRQVCKDRNLWDCLLGKVEGNPGLLRPVFYSGVPLARIRELVAGDPLFKIEGFERSTNYQRLSG
jgi:radical SAM superfamily enzyme YgiQ (UPF0313 family)